MNDMAFDYEQTEDEERGFFQRHGFVLGVGGIVAVVAVVFAGQSLFKHGPKLRPAPEVHVVDIVSTPLPPPPPPPPPPEQRMQQETPRDQQMIENTPDKPQQAPPQPNEVGTNIKGDGGPDAFGLSGNGSAGFNFGAREGGSGSGRNHWGAYALQVQSTIGDALRRNARTRDASFRIVVRIWPDAAGRIRRAQLAGTTGDPAVDAALRNEILTGLQLREPPPEGMPSPIVMRLTARRPN